MLFLYVQSDKLHSMKHNFLFLLTLMVATVTFGQNDSAKQIVSNDTISIAELMEVLSISGIVSYAEAQVMSKDQRENVFIKNRDETGAFVIGSLNAYGYKTCVDVFTKIAANARGKYGQEIASTQEVDFPSYVKSILDYQSMATALSVGSAWVKLTWKFKINDFQGLLLQLDCSQKKYNVLIVISNS